VRTRLHLGEFEFAVAVGVHGGSNAIGGDQLDAHAFGGIAALDLDDACCTTGESGLHRPFVGLRLIPRIHRRIFALHTAFAGVNVGYEIGHVRIRQIVAVCRHELAAVFDLGRDGFVVNGAAG